MESIFCKKILFYAYRYRGKTPYNPMATNNNINSFVNFIDDYAKQMATKTEQKTIDYQYLSALINTNYLGNYLYDTRFVGIVPNHRMYYNYYPTMQNQEQNLQKSMLHRVEVPPNYYSYFSNSQWNNISTDMYSHWQKEHDVTASFHADSQETKPTSNNIEKTKVSIDISISKIEDILSVIEKYPLLPENEYNIDLKSLHNIKTELIELNNMIGMQSLKQSVLEQLLYFVQELHVGKNISDFKHTVIYGPPGTGKTEIAKIIGRMYSKIGVLSNNIFKKVTRSDLIAGYLGQTAIKTKKVITESLGGVLFIDEAYSLASKEDNDIYSKECIDILCESLSDHKNDFMVILAGYEDELNETIFRVNRGMESRFIWRFKIDDYSSKELMQIFKKKVLEQEWEFDTEMILKESWFSEKKTNFKSYGRDMELLLLYVKIAHGKRIYGKDTKLRKIIDITDMNNGYNTFLKNKDLKKIPEHIRNMYI
jgi:SpoVK/Ycf46/Vps4 family AAA+-type ATPase